MALLSSAHLLFFLLLLLFPPHLLMIATSALHFSFSTFMQQDTSRLKFSAYTSTINYAALQVTPDSGARSLDLVNASGQITFWPSKLRLWDPAYNYSATFNTSFLMNMGPIGDGGSNQSGGGMAFFLTPVIATQIPGSFGPFLGLHNSSFNDPNHRFFAVEFDTFKDSFQLDPDNNHVGIDINSTRSLFTKPLDAYNVTLNANVSDAGTNTSVWIDYDGHHHELDVYLANNGAEGLGTKPSSPVISRYKLDLRQYLPKDVYVGFSASSGSIKETHCVLIWNFSSVVFPNYKEHGPFRLGIALGVGLSVCALLIVLVILLILFLRRRKGKALLPDMATDYGPRRFKFKDLKKATKGFSDECKLGQGGFGAVYRGTLGSREGSTEVAVKRLSQNSRQGKKEFMREIDSIGKMRHKNLVRLLGWSFDGWTGRLMLVYEYMPNGSLDRWIHPPSQNMGMMDWNRRLHVLKGVAAGLLYLHEEWDMVVVHRDLKPSNIMLDSDFNARLGDFGLARFIKNKVTRSEGSDQQQHDSTQTMTIAGTPGYIAPECMTGTITKESDVYSFGAVAMELATGKKSSAENLLWLWKLYESGQLQAAEIDNGLENYDKNEMELVLRLIISCCQPQPASRPSMRQIVHLLNSSSSSSSAVDDFSSSFPIAPPAASFFAGITLDSLVSLASSPSQHLLSSSTTSY